MGNNVNKYGWTPLHIAVEKGHLEIVKVLIASGGSVNKADNVVNVLFVASWNGHLEIVKVLIASGVLVNNVNNNGWTPLYFASLKGHLEIVKVLLIASGGLLNK